MTSWFMKLIFKLRHYKCVRVGYRYPTGSVSARLVIGYQQVIIITYIEGCVYYCVWLRKLRMRN